jgi:multiple sugar transport system permease protein/cellobiose transport system permease protein
MRAGGVNKKNLTKAGVYTLMILLSVIALVPFYLMLIMGTHYNEDLYKGIHLLPGNYLRENLKTIMKLDYPRYYFNSIFIAICNTAGGVMVSALSGYAFSKFRFKGRGFFMSFVIATLAIPMQLGLVGYVVEMRRLGIIDTLLPMIFSGMASGFGVFWMTQFIGSAVPTEIIESGRIDGCSEYRIFFQLALPIIKPAIITIGLLLFLWSWNSYIVPLVIVTRKECYTIPLSISMVSTEFRTDYAARILSLAISTFPIVLMFAFGSKHLIKGLTAGSVKG